MAFTRSLVFGNLNDQSTKTAPTVKPAQEFVRDVVLVQPSLNPYSAIQSATQVVSSGRSLFLEYADRSRRT